MHPLGTAVAKERQLTCVKRSETNDPGSVQGEHFDFDRSEITDHSAVKFVDRKVALCSTTGESIEIFDSGFDRVWKQKPWESNEVLYCGHEPRVWQ